MCMCVCVYLCVFAGVRVQMANWARDVDSQTPHTCICMNSAQREYQVPCNLRMCMCMCVCVCV